MPKEMDRLDIFAAHAMCALVPMHKDNDDDGLELLAFAAYRIARAMCAERARVDMLHSNECLEIAVSP